MEFNSHLRIPFRVVSQNIIDRKQNGQQPVNPVKIHQPLLHTLQPAIPNAQQGSVASQTLPQTVKVLSLPKNAALKIHQPWSLNVNAHQVSSAYQKTPLIPQTVKLLSLPKKNAQRPQAVLAALPKKNEDAAYVKAKLQLKAISQQITKDDNSNSSSGVAKDVNNKHVLVAEKSKIIPNSTKSDSTIHEKVISDKGNTAQKTYDSDDDVFVPKTVKGAPRKASDLTVNLSSKKAAERKKQGVRLKDSEITSFISQVQEKNLTTQSFEKVHDIVPSSPSFVVTDCIDTDSESKWTATIRANICDKQEAIDWLCEFEQTNSLDFRVLKTKKENSSKLLMKREYRCHHRTIPRTKEEISYKDPGTKKIYTGVNSGYFEYSDGKTRIFNHKNTNCPASVRITIKQKSMKWSSDMLLQKYPCEIVIKHHHNHPVHAAEVLRRRRPTETVKKKFIEMFQKGHSPLSALECHKFDLKTEYGDNYYVAAADRSICPSNFWTYKLYKKLCIQKYGPQCGDDMINALKTFCEDYNSQCKEICCKVDTDSGHLIVAICTPIMRRVHKLLDSSAEIMLVDSSGTMDCLNCRVFPLLTTSVAGGLPLGIIITTSEGETVLKNALNLWTSLLPEDAFFGRGPKIGPKIVMTDDATAERNALKFTFKECILLLCIFHVLQAYWRFIWNRESDVPKENRSELFFLFKDLVYARSEEEFKDRWKDAMENEHLSKAPKVKSHLEKLLPRISEWALFMRQDLLTRGNNTNNYSEVNMKILKEKMLDRMKAFNPVQLLDFLLTRYDTYLVNRIIDVINNRSSNPFKSRYFIRPEKLVDLECVQVPSTPNTYQVVNRRKKTDYIVVMDYEICSCPAGQSGTPCKHLCKVVQQFNLSSSHIHPLLQCNDAHKKVLFEIAHGHSNVPAQWFAGLFDDVDKLTQDSGVIAREEIPSEVLPDAVSEENEHSDNQNTSESSPPEELQNTLDGLKDVFDSYVDMLKSDPVACQDGFNAFIKQNLLLKNSQSGLIAAFHNFGKTSSLALGSKKRNLSSIPVQPTSASRRTTYLGGKKCQFTGRPPKAMGSSGLTSDHVYASNTTKRTHEEPVWSSVPKRLKTPAPHRLQLCVDMSRMIGTKH